MAASTLDDALQRVRFLEDQVNHIKSLHERAESRLAHLLACPNDIALHQANLYNPEIAVPLLQCYDVEIAQLKDKVTVLMTENREIRADNDDLRVALQRAGEGRSAAVDAKLAEEHTAVQREEDVVRIKQLSHELDRRSAELGHAQREISDLREQLSRNHVTQSRGRDEQERFLATTASLESANVALKVELDAATQQLAAALKHLHAIKLRDDEDKALLESQRVQLQLLAQENEDKMQELDRLRAKMVHVLHQAGENHTTHLKIVEEKHADALRVAREEGRAHEITSAKLRAQMARIEHSPTYANGVGAISATHAIEAQARHAQELELKRLYAEVASAQLQRDDAIARVDHLTALHRTEVDDRVRELSRTLELARSRQRDVEDRVERLEVELERTKESAAAARAEHRAALQDRNRLDAEKNEVVRQLEEARRAKIAAVSAQEHAESTASEQAERDRRAIRALERRLDDCKTEMHTLKDRTTSEIEQLTRVSEEHRSAARDAVHRLEATVTALAEKERQHESTAMKCDRLTQGLAQHKQQLSVCDERLLALSAREGQLATELRAHVVALEQARADIARASRERDRAVAEAQLLSSHLSKVAKQGGTSLAFRAAAH